MNFLRDVRLMGMMCAALSLAAMGCGVGGGGNAIDTTCPGPGCTCADPVCACQTGQNCALDCADVDTTNGTCSLYCGAGSTCESTCVDACNVDCIPGATCSVTAASDAD